MAGRLPRALVAFALLAAACAPTATAVSKPPVDVVIGPTDVPSGLRMTVDRDRTKDEIAEGLSKEKLDRMGFKASRLREFRGEGKPLAILSTVTLYGGHDGAKEAYRHNISSVREGDPPSSEVALPEMVGDESTAFRLFPEQPEGAEISMFAILFRFANASNAILVAGSPAEANISFLIELAKKQLAKQRP